MTKLKRVLLIVFSLLLAMYSFTAYAEVISQANDELVVVNKSNHLIYVYDEDYGTLKATQPITTDGLEPGRYVIFKMQAPANPNGAARRIYITSQRMSHSIEIGSPPDCFNPQVDGTAMYTFVEYNYIPSENNYTIETSYIDEWTYPVTLKFSESYANVVQGDFEYGFTSISEAVQALRAIRTDGKESWGYLVWDTNNPGGVWPDGIYRVIGPDKVWAQNSGGQGATDLMPTSYQKFVGVYPYNGQQLFGASDTNFNCWLTSSTLPANTGYVKALRSVAKADINGKYNFMTYCYDTQNQPTNIPTSVHCVLTVY